MCLLAKYCKHLELFHFRHDDPFNEYQAAKFLRYISTLSASFPETFMTHSTY